MSSRTPLIAGNWKMNMDHLQAIAFVQKLAWSLSDAKHDFSSVDVAIFPPFTDLRSVQTLISADKLKLQFGAQDVSSHVSGAYTGEISATFLAKLECKYVLIGHSERRTIHQESDALVNAKVHQVLMNEMIPVICVGESAEDLENEGKNAVPLRQLRAALEGVSVSATFVVAYEPVWAIGSGVAATPAQAEEVARALREAISEQLGSARADATRILYGGSVRDKNIAHLMSESHIDGVLVGGASLDVTEFSRIVQYQKHVTI